MANLVIQSTNLPFHNAAYLDAIESAMSAANAELSVTFLLSGNAVFQLVSQQNNEAVSRKNIIKQIKVLHVYGVEKICVFAPEFFNSEEKTIKSEDLYIENIAIINESEFNHIMQSAHQVLVF